MSTTPEKYVSIEYEKWNTFYKPLEEKYVRLERELESERENKKVKVYLDTHRALIPQLKYRGYVGVIDLVGESFHSFTPNPGYKNIVNEVVEWIKKDNYELRFTSAESLENVADKIKNQTKKLEEQEKRITKKKKTIPRLVRWIFKIK